MFSFYWLVFLPISLEPDLSGLDISFPFQWFFSYTHTPLLFCCSVETEPMSFSCLLPVLGSTLSRPLRDRLSILLNLLLPTCTVAREQTWLQLSEKKAMCHREGTVHPSLICSAPEGGPSSLVTVRGRGVLRTQISWLGFGLVLE